MTAEDDLREHIRRLVDDWPPLSNAQRVRLRALLQPDVAAPRRSPGGPATHHHNAIPSLPAEPDEYRAAA